ncbi:MAG: hypothetical protein M1827_005597 [Pycnora praestabilis]|nr:MAG: hypothetical protein M1827_005597 [Pycnora praestabilis]
MTDTSYLQRPTSLSFMDYSGQARHDPRGSPSRCRSKSRSCDVDTPNSSDWGSSTGVLTPALTVDSTSFSTIFEDPATSRTSSGPAIIVSSPSVLSPEIFFEEVVNRCETPPSYFNSLTESRHCRQPFAKSDESIFRATTESKVKSRRQKTKAKRSKSRSLSVASGIDYGSRGKENLETQGKFPHVEEHICLWPGCTNCPFTEESDLATHIILAHLRHTPTVSSSAEQSITLQRTPEALMEKDYNVGSPSIEHDQEEEVIHGIFPRAQNESKLSNTDTHTGSSTPSHFTTTRLHITLEEYLSLLESDAVLEADDQLKHSRTNDDASGIFYEEETSSIRIRGAKRTVAEARIVVGSELRRIRRRSKGSILLDDIASALPKSAGKDASFEHEPRFSAHNVDPTVTNQHEVLEEGYEPLLRIYVIDAEKEKGLVKAWETHILPLLESLLPPVLGEVLTAELINEGPSKELARPIIRIQSPSRPSEEKGTYLSNKIDTILQAELQRSIPVKFCVGKIERTGDLFDPEYEQACRTGNETLVEDGSRHSPRRWRYQRKPMMGTSIGHQGSYDSCATLGGYLLVDGKECILTVNHAFQSEEHCDGTSQAQTDVEEIEATQPSSKDLDGIKRYYRNRLAEMQTQLNVAVKLGASITSLRPILHYRKLVQQDLSTLPTESDLTLGRVTSLSGFGSRTITDTKGISDQDLSKLGAAACIEMDWAIITVNPSRVGYNRLFPKDDLLATQKDNPTLSTATDHPVSGFCPIEFGAEVHSVARSSGYQSGRISGARGLVSFKYNDKVRRTAEYFVIKDEHQTTDHWNNEGMGQPGDSGSWVVQKSNNRLCGQVWGRNITCGSGDRITYITPVIEIFEDILRITGAKSIELPVDRHPGTSAIARVVFRRSIVSQSNEEPSSLDERKERGMENDRTCSPTMPHTPKIGYKRPSTYSQPSLKRQAFSPSPAFSVPSTPASLPNSFDTTFSSQTLNGARADYPTPASSAFSPGIGEDVSSPQAVRSVPAAEQSNDQLLTPGPSQALDKAYVTSPGSNANISATEALPPFPEDYLSSGSLQRSKQSLKR